MTGKDSAALEDTAGQVRDGEELNADAVDAWLKSRLTDLSGSPEITQYSGGASNWTYRLKYPKHDLILRRPPAGTKAKGAHDMGREYRIQAGLAPVYPHVAKMIAHCDDESVIGAEFYIMERVSGLIPRSNMPPGLDLSKDQVRSLCTNALDCLIELHQVDVDAAGLQWMGKGAGYAQRQIDGWIGRYGKARTWNAPRFRGVMDWLADNIPEESGICVVHNDFRFDNVVLDPNDPTSVLAILDWELATLGDPLMDLGNTLAYWTQADDDFMRQATRRQPTHLPGMLTRAEVVEYYCGKTGLQPKNWVWYEAYGLFRLGVIAQQIYYRYYHKQTRNPAFRNFWLLEHYLQWRLKRMIRQA